MRNKHIHRILLLTLFTHLPLWVHAFFEIGNGKEIIESKLQNVSYKFSDPEYSTVVKMISGQINRDLFAKITHAFSEEERANLGFAVSEMLSKMGAHFYQGSVELESALYKKITPLFGFDPDGFPSVSLPFALLLYLISFLSDEDLAELANENLSLKETVVQILGSAYDNMISNSVDLSE